MESDKEEEEKGTTHPECQSAISPTRMANSPAGPFQSRRVLFSLGTRMSPLNSERVNGNGWEMALAKVGAEGHQFVGIPTDQIHLADASCRNQLLQVGSANSIRAAGDHWVREKLARIFRQQHSPVQLSLYGSKFKGFEKK